MEHFSAKRLLLQKDILLESGTNELEVLVFYLAGAPYGVNVAKVREVLPPVVVHKLPETPACVEGAFRLRERVVSLIDLRCFLGLTCYTDAERTDREKCRFIVTEFNQTTNGFRIDAVEQIHRVSWSEVKPIPEIEGVIDTPVTAVTMLHNKLIPLLDFEQIIDRIHTSQALRPGFVNNTVGIDRHGKVLALAEDSRMVRKLIAQTLSKSGYEQLHVFGNGKQLWDWLQQLTPHPQTGLAGLVDLVLTDIEMPQIDGLHLTKLIREHPLFRDLPVMLFSSLITPDNLKKGKAVGVTAQIAKPQLYRVVSLVDAILSGQEVASATAEEAPLAVTKAKTNAAVVP